MNNLCIAEQDVQKEHVYLPDFLYQDLGHHTSGCVFTLPKSNHLQNLLTRKDNLLKETTHQTINLLSKNIFKFPQEILVKTTIDKRIEKLTVSFVNESYFLYDKSNVIAQTFITEINKLIPLYGSIS